MRIILKDVVGYYRVYDDNKKVNFSFNDKPVNILEHIEEKLEITLTDFTYEEKGGEYFRATASNETLILKEGKVILKEDVMYTCRALLQIQSIFFNTKGDIR